MFSALVKILNILAKKPSLFRTNASPRQVVDLVPRSVTACTIKFKYVLDGLLLIIRIMLYCIHLSVVFIKLKETNIK